jgi:hypothetical protein
MNYDTQEIKKEKEKAPVMFVQLCDQRDSGWVMDGTGGTKNEVRITSPSAEFIPNKGFRLVKQVNPETQKEEWVNEPIRFIKNQHIISFHEQRQKGIEPSKTKLEDKIIIKGGNFSVTREGAFIGLYDYLQQVFYNESNPNRPQSAKAIYKVIELGKIEEVFNESEVAYADSIQFISTLYSKQGDKKFIYNEDRINSLCQIFMIFAETPAGKISGLMAWARKDPANFLDKALRFEQTIQMEITHALELSVMKFDGNTALYCNKDKVIADLGRGNLKHETKINKLGDLFGTPEYKAVYDEFKVELSAAKDK